MKNVLRFFMVLCMALASTAVFVSPILAQTSNTGTITGVVSDEKGATIPGATVRARHIGTNAERTATTSSEGVYEFAQLVPGTYRVEVEAQGFSKVVHDNVVVNVLQRTTLNPELKVGSIGETVTVTGETAPLVETTKTDVGGVIDQRRLENLPVNGRSFASLAILISRRDASAILRPNESTCRHLLRGRSDGPKCKRND